MTTARPTIGLIGAGHMGSALGAALLAGGHPVLTALDGRSARTARFVAENGIAVVSGLPELVTAAEVLLVVTPPAAALPAATSLAEAARATGASPLVVDLNAIAPSTVDAVAAVLAEARLGLVDGSISGPPPTVRPGARIYLSGPDATRVAGLAWTGVAPIVVGPDVGTASAVKMCTASVYKGLVGLFTQAIRAGAHYGVLEPVLSDLATGGHDPLGAVAVAATKAARFVPEMHEIAAAQAAAGLPASLFEAFAEVYTELARTALAGGDPESIDRDLSAADLVAGLAPRP
jgi:3-hydroxyisobutyrate dehydrogenase-like beta-hydroxyacid dehydrogenase